MNNKFKNQTLLYFYSEKLINSQIYCWKWNKIVEGFNGLSNYTNATLIKIEFFVLISVKSSGVESYFELPRYVIYCWYRERKIIWEIEDGWYGLSPLARGTLHTSRSDCARPRFIPADAGNSAQSGCGYAVPPFYPRWRGELSKHNLLLINDFLSQSQSTNFTGSHKQHIYYVKEHLIHWLKR